MLRILKASAKIRYSDKIEEKDIERAINILNCSYYQIPTYEFFKEEDPSEELGVEEKIYSKEQEEIEKSTKLGEIQWKKKHLLN